MKENIICSAIHFDNKEVYEHQPFNIKSGLVVCGMRHHNCFMAISAIASILGKDISAPRVFSGIRETQGFLTNKNRFIDRSEGREIALAQNQVIDKSKLGKDILFSEDLY